MTKTEKYWLMAGGLLALMLLPLMALAPSYQVITDWLIPSFEGFSATPYWDNKQYTWGYGTRAPGPTGTITREQALIELRKHVANDYLYLRGLVHVPLSANQWAAFLSFSYNLGTGNADNLVSNINAQNWPALEDQWKLYVKSNGVTLDSLVDRRDREWNIFTGQV